MLGQYSSKLRTPLMIEDGESSRMYKAQKLSAVRTEYLGAKILFSLFPSAGAAWDAHAGDAGFNQSNTAFSFFQTLHENITEDLMEEIHVKLLGSLVVNDKPLGDSWPDHFDEYPQDLLEVLVWAFKEDMHSVFMRSGIVMHRIEKMKKLIPQDYLSKIEDVMKGLKGSEK